MFSIVVATDLNLGIGKNNSLPWRLKTDMGYFKDLTIERNRDSVMDKYGIFPNNPNGLFPTLPDGVTCDNNVIMGRKTWESIPEKFRPLGQRFNVVLSRNYTCEVKNTKVASSLDVALDEFTSLSPNTYVIGGAEIYRQAVAHPKCQLIYLTQIYKAFECDTFFPEYKDAFELTNESKMYTENDIEFQFKVFTRK